MTTAYTASNPVAMASLPTTNGIVQRFTINVTNTSDATYTPDGLTSAPIYGLGGQALQGNEMVANSIATLVSYVGPLLNSGKLCWILFDCTAGAQQTAAATAGRHAVQFGQVSGVVGQSRNLTINILTASASATLKADEVIVESALGGLRYCVPNVNFSINLTTTGIGGMDAGSAPVSGFVGVYLGYNPTTGVAGLFATDATSTKVPEVYVGANQPTGYTASALVAVLPTNASAQFPPATLVERQVSFVQNTVFNSPSILSTPTPIVATNVLPYNAVRAGGNAGFSNSSSVVAQINVFSNASGVGSNTVNGVTTSQNGAFTVDIVVPRTFYVTTNSLPSGTVFTAALSRYSF